MNTQLRSLILAASMTLVLAACGKKDEAPPPADAAPAVPAAEAKELNIYIWSDYLPQEAVDAFAQETGIKVRVDNYDSNETLEAKLLTGSSGYDIVVPTSNFLEKQIKANVYRKLDKSQLTNLKNMDSDINQRLSLHDPSNEHAVNYMWGTTGIGYNVAKVKKAMPNAPTDSWKMVFDPAIVKNFKSCGVAVLDSPSEMTDMVLAYLGKDPNSQSPDDLKAVEETLMKIRPFIKYIHSSQYIADLASGEICIAVGYNGDILQARERAEENKTGVEVKYSVPKEGTIIWFDSMAIPADAPHPNNAHLFIDYMMRPEVIAKVSDSVQYANGNQAATALVNKDVTADAGIYPPPEVKAKLFPNLADTDEFTRLQTRTWTRFSTGQ